LRIIIFRAPLTVAGGIAASSAAAVYLRLAAHDAIVPSRLRISRSLAHAPAHLRAHLRTSRHGVAKYCRAAARLRGDGQHIGRRRRGKQRKSGEGGGCRTAWMTISRCVLGRRNEHRIKLSRALLNISDLRKWRQAGRREAFAA
jgi:hypothetical protein